VPFVEHHPVVVDTVTTCPVYGFDPAADGIDLGVLSTFEGYSDTLYQPAAGSGPTIGYGLDLAHAAPGTIRYVLSGLVPNRVMAEILTAQGKTGKAASDWIESHKYIKLDRCASTLVSSRQYGHYWKSVAAGRPYLNAAPREIKTAVTSFVMHTGKVDPLLPALRALDWDAVAEAIRSFHDDWRGPESLAFRKRRVLEAKLIGLRGTRGVSSRGYYD
jgi:GH24 family phage-related lysozyme (muramidase)